jgi:hypothetical protein
MDVEQTCLARQFERSSYTTQAIYKLSHFYTKKVLLQFIHTIHAVKYLIAEVIIFLCTSLALLFSVSLIACQHTLLFSLFFISMCKLPHTSGEASYKAWCHSWTPCLKFTRSYTEFSGLAESTAERSVALLYKDKGRTL